MDFLSANRTHIPVAFTSVLADLGSYKDEVSVVYSKGEALLDVPVLKLVTVCE